MFFWSLWNSGEWEDFETVLVKVFIDCEGTECGNANFLDFPVT